MASTDPSRTPANWAKRCGEFAAALHPDYTRNSQVRGTRTEFLRLLPERLWVSINFQRIRDTYYLCFALLFSTRTSPFLYSPLLVGSRFDHSRNVHALFREEFGPPKATTRPYRGPPGLWSYGEWRRDTLGRVERGMQIVETVLLPHYVARVRKNARALARLFGRAAQLVPELRRLLDQGATPSARTIARAEREFGEQAGWDASDRAVRRWVQVLAAAESLGADPIDLLAQRSECINRDALGALTAPSVDGVIVWHFDQLEAEGSRVGEIAAGLAALAG